jgi:hypothetical protein
MARKRIFTYDERLRMLAAAMDFCPDCQREMDSFARQQGKDVFTLIREVIWKWYGQWPHGAGCPQPEAAATAAPEAQAEPRKALEAQTLRGTTLPAAASAENRQEHTMGFTTDPETTAAQS